MPSAAQLSDGKTFTNIPDGLNADQEAGMVAQAEARLANHYGEVAKQQNAPVTTPGHIYSATRTYPNSYLGSAMAWADHNIGGNWANQNIVDPVNQATGGAADAVAGTVGRVESNVPGIIDLPGAAFNTAKHVIGETPAGSSFWSAYGPGVSVPDVPYLTENIRKEVGVPELPADAGYAQRIGEGTASALLGGGWNEAAPLLGAGRTALGTGASTILSDIGNALFGEGGGFLGGVIGSGGGDLAARKAFHTAGRGWGHPDAPQMNQDYNATVGGSPSSMTLSGPGGQRVIKIIGAIPLTGSPIERANEATSEGIRTAKTDAANQIFGPGGVPPRITDESIGEPLVSGAQQGSVALKAQQNRVWNNLNQIMQGNHEVDLAPAATAIEREQNTNPTTERNVNTVRGLLGEATDFAPGGPMYSEANRGPTPPLPQPTLNVPWSVAKDVGTQLKNRVRAAAQQGLSIPDTMVAALKDSVNAAMAQATQSAGLRNLYDTARTSYAQMKPILDRLYSVGGKPVGDTGSFEKPMGSGEAARDVLYANRQNSRNLQPFADSATFPNQNWRRAVAQWIAQMGMSDQNTFRPEHFYRDWTGSKKGEGLSDEVQQQVTQGPGGRPTGVADILSRLANVAKNAVTPVSRHGLTSSVVAAGALEALMGGARALGHEILPMGGGLVLPTLVGTGLSHGFESEAYKRGTTGQSLMSPESRANFVQSNLPVAGAVTAQEVDNRRRQAAQDEAFRQKMRKGAIP